MPDRNKHAFKKEKTNQYINETELKSLIIRINNKTFLESLSNSFKRLDKYILKYQNIDKNNIKNPFKKILSFYIKKVYLKCLKSKKSQLMLIPDDMMKKMILMIETPETPLEDIISFMEPLRIEMNIKNFNLNNNRKTDIKRIDKYIAKHSKSKSQKLKKLLREYIVKIAERNIIDKISYERFGELVLLIIKNILKKPKFSGYTYRDDFYSDSTDKIFRYLKNFNHTMISKITGQQVNSFSYLSQYVHNSIIFIINTKNTEKAEVEKYVNTYNENIRLLYNESEYIQKDKEFNLYISKIKKTLFDDILDLTNEYNNFNILNLFYPEDYKISLNEYKKLKDLNTLLNKTIRIQRSKGKTHNDK